MVIPVKNSSPNIASHYRDDCVEGDSVKVLLIVKVPA